MNNIFTKKILLVFALIFSLNASAYDIVVDGIYYKYINNKTELQVTSSTSFYSGDVVIPADVTIDGTNYSVTSIADGAFRNSSPLTSVVVGANVKTIGLEAFSNCSSLKTATIPNGVTEIKDRAFINCKKLEHVDIPTGISYIGDRCFESDEVLDNVVIPGNVKTIRPFAFHWCTSMKKLTLSEGIEVIANSSFEELNSLEELVIPNSVKEIQNTAFAALKSIKKIEVPNTIDVINYAVFCNCHSVEEVILPNTIKKICSRAFESAKTLKSIVIPSSVTEIESNSFRYSDNLTAVTCLAAATPSLGYGAFTTYGALYVREGSKTAYEMADNWKKFSPIIEGDYEPEGGGSSDSDNPPVPEDKKGYVDLGLPSGKLWATCNVGAESEEEYGTYFDWEKNPVQEYWDEVWRTPTKEERDELLANCSYSLDTVNGVKGARYTGVNGNSIFFPFGGYYQSSIGPLKVGEGGQYWTVTPYISKTHWILAANRNPNTDEDAYYWPNPYFSFPVRAIRDKLEVPEGCVDLGLKSGTLWATCNVDAEQPEQYGGYYAWGELEEKSVYNSSTYKYQGKDIGESICATDYDVAYVKSNGKFRMPTKDEIEELHNECTWVKEELNSVIGYTAEGPNGNKIFLPLAGGKGYTGNNNIGISGYYWTGISHSSGYAVRFDLNSTVASIYLYNGAKYDGRPIRPVYCEPTVTAVTTVKTTSDAGVIYRIDGTVTNTLKRGINIIRRADGSCYKVISK